MIFPAEKNSFDFTLQDSQGTAVSPVEPKNFDIERYVDYETALLEKNSKFWRGDRGIQIYRRFRVPEVFSHGAGDMKTSLALQLGALKASMEYKGDIANFLEPWYGIGTIASAFGVKYRWEDGQAPATEPPFRTVKEALNYETQSVEETEIGGHTLEMIEYFLDKTKGKIPLSLTDTQSPFNTASYLVDTNSFYLSLFDHPYELKQLLRRITEVTAAFTKKQLDIMGDAVVWPGHGFASSREFEGLGISDDNMMMLSSEQYKEIEAPNNENLGRAFGGIAFHSCGNWSKKIEAVMSMKGLKVVDAAFTEMTDPDPNPAAPIKDRIPSSGIVVNARMVGETGAVAEKVREIWAEGMKLVLVSYAGTSEEQSELYDAVYQIIEETGE